MIHCLEARATGLMARVGSGFIPGKPQGSRKDDSGQMGCKSGTDVCSLEAEPVPRRHSGFWEYAEPHSAGR